jgi:hypothetical protein
MITPRRELVACIFTAVAGVFLPENDYATTGIGSLHIRRGGREFFYQKMITPRRE